MASHEFERSRPRTETAVAVEKLLIRYPDLTEPELATLIKLFPSIAILDLGLMTADETLAAKLDAFHHDHGDKLKTPISSLIAFLGVPTIIASGGLLWWLLAPAAGM
jgi:hypothetical protein